MFCKHFDDYSQEKHIPYLFKCSINLIPDVHILFTFQGWEIRLLYLYSENIIEKKTALYDDATPEASPLRPLLQSLFMAQTQQLKEMTYHRYLKAFTFHMSRQVAYDMPSSE